MSAHLSGSVSRPPFDCIARGVGVERPSYGGDVGTTLAEIRQAYKQLEDLSVAARYLAEKHPLGRDQVQRAERLADEVLRACGIS